MIADKTNKKIISIEKAGNTTSIKNVNKLFIHTNHYIHKKFFNKYSGEENFGTSKERISISEKVFNQNDDQDEFIKKIIKELKRPVNEQDHNDTFATVLCDVNSGIIQIFHPKTKSCLFRGQL